MSNCSFCGRNNYMVIDGCCATCREVFEVDDIDLGVRWLYQGHTMECVRRMLEMKMCNCGVKYEKSKSKRIDDTKSSE